MKKTVKILILILLPAFVFSQDKKLTIAVAGAPAFYDIKPAKGFDHDYTKKMSYRAGVDIAWHLGKRSAIATGAYYSTLGYTVGYKYIFIQSNDPFIPRNTAVTANYLDIPLTYNFNVVAKRKLELYLLAGVVYSRLISSDAMTTYEDNSVRSSSNNLSESLFGLQTGIGAIYNTTDRIGIKLEPHYRFCNKGIDNLMYPRTNAFDVTIGIVFTLWKSK